MWWGLSICLCIAVVFGETQACMVGFSQFHASGASLYLRKSIFFFRENRCGIVMFSIIYFLGTNFLKLKAPLSIF